MTDQSFDEAFLSATDPARMAKVCPDCGLPTARLFWLEDAPRAVCHACYALSLTTPEPQGEPND